MALFPDVAKKAQAEIDAVVGNDRLPTFADREHLPYVDALAKEVLRWNTVVPTGMRLTSSTNLRLKFYFYRCPASCRARRYPHRQQRKHIFHTQRRSCCRKYLVSRCPFWSSVLMTDLRVRA